MKHLLCITIVTLSLALFSHAGVIQEMIDAADAGAVVMVPAGTYVETIALKDGMTLVGEGAETTVIDGEGAACIVSAGKDSALVGFTIRNGQIGISNDGKAVGVFECRIEECAPFAIRLTDNGCGVIANNIIDGNGKSTGIGCYGSNPYIVNNYIMNHQVGLLAFQNFVPQVSQNYFISNSLAISVGGGSFVLLSENTFEGNKVNIRGQELGETDIIGAIEPPGLYPVRSGTFDQYRNLMTLVFDEKVAEHPLAIYDLTTPVGSFGVITLFPWASFSVAASAVDTVIADYEAYDWVTEKILFAELQKMQNGRPTVLVNNAELIEQEQDRYVLDNLYIHPASFFAGPDGTLVFKRETSFSRVELIIPQGYIPTSVNVPCDFEWLDGELIGKITDVGYTRIEMTLSPIGAGMADPYGVLD
ncbi:MAG: hypothetical protein EOM20_05950 [Spartobacteria bacterium]|nr:hypothetical protein [Spartobacteria bacterium]